MEKLENIRKKYEKIENVSESIYLALDEAIVTGLLPPGTRLLEAELAETLGVSRTPVRESLKRLIADELIVHTAQGGLKVKEYTVAEMCDIFEAVESLRQITTRLAADKIDLMHLTQLATIIEAIENCQEDSTLRLDLDEKFHQFVCDSTGNKVLINFYKKLLKQHAIIRHCAGLTTAHSLEANQERKDIYDALANHDKDKAFRIAVEHSRHMLGRIKILVSQDQFS
jgi:DNA-binding GntR family transcriptional regulator